MAARQRKISLPVDAIQKNPNNLQISNGNAPLFLEPDPPHKPEITAPMLPIESATLVVDKMVNIRESDSDVITDVVLQNGDVYVVEASGSIWAGVAATGQNGPNGWSDITWDARFPLHGGLDPKNAHPFCLLGRHYGGYFFIGEGGQRQRYIFPLDAALWLRINDDTPGHDHGSRYLGKIFNPEWMRAMGYETVEGPTARDLVKNKKVSEIVGIEETATVAEAIRRMSQNDFSQVPVTRDRRIVGSLSSETHAYASIVKDPALLDQPVKAIMQKVFRFIDIETPVTLLAPMITPENPALLVRDFRAGQTYILTGSDVLSAI